MKPEATNNVPEWNLKSTKGYQKMENETTVSEVSFLPKSMQKIMGEENGESSLQFLQTTEQMDRRPAPIANTKISALQCKWSRTHLHWPHHREPVLSAVQSSLDEKNDGLPDASQPERTAEKDSMKRKATLKKLMIKGLNNEKDEIETNKYLEHWGSNPEVRDMVHEFLNTAKSKDKTVNIQSRS